MPRVNENYDIFFSHSDDTTALSIAVKQFFETRGLRVYDYKHDKRGVGEQLDNYLVRLIRGSRHVVLLITDSAIDSKWVELEVKAAEDYHINLVALRFSGIKVPARFQNIRHIEFSTSEELNSSLAIHEWNQWVDVYIPAGGFGGSNYEFSPHIPKVLYPIGKKPLLFHVLGSLECQEFCKAVVLNKAAPDYVAYLTTLGLAEFPLDVECRQTEAPCWPQAIAEQKPSRTFVVQLCDVLLHLGESDTQLKAAWEQALEQHRWFRQDSRDYLGTLIVSKQYTLAVGTVKIGNTYRVPVDGVGENPTLPDLPNLNINTGTAILEPEILPYIKQDDPSLLGGAIERARKAKKKFGAFLWDDQFDAKHKWHHVLNLNEYNNLKDLYSDDDRTKDKPKG